MKSMLGRIGFVATKYATAATLLVATFSIGGGGNTITRDAPTPDGTGGDNHVGNYCHDEVSNLGNQQGGQTNRQTPKPGATNRRDASVVE